ncbi:glucosylceramide transporter ABCA12 [Protopterus annectens]|uniref:glucosylceramide transporter ABCA12 n=1 Tax=Protopterus annectens TaxID=7888 RepID=UPI001CF9F62A|nr:glucosylceramide transporter ABCA12 [Protopterus annectens]
MCSYIYILASVYVCFQDLNSTNASNSTNNSTDSANLTTSISTLGRTGSASSLFSSSKSDITIANTYFEMLYFQNYTFLKASFNELLSDPRLIADIITIGMQVQTDPNLYDALYTLPQVFQLESFQTMLNASLIIVKNIKSILLDMEVSQNIALTTEISILDTTSYIIQHIASWADKVSDIATMQQHKEQALSASLQLITQILETAQILETKFYPTPVNPTTSPKDVNCSASFSNMNSSIPTNVTSLTNSSIVANESLSINTSHCIQNATPNPGADKNMSSSKMIKQVLSTLVGVTNDSALWDGLFHMFQSGDFDMIVESSITVLQHVRRVLTGIKADYEISNITDGITMINKMLPVYQHFHNWKGKEFYSVLKDLLNSTSYVEDQQTLKTISDVNIPVNKLWILGNFNSFHDYICGILNEKSSVDKESLSRLCNLTNPQLQNFYKMIDMSKVADQVLRIWITNISQSDVNFTISYAKYLLQKNLTNQNDSSNLNKLSLIQIFLNKWFGLTSDLIEDQNVLSQHDVWYNWLKNIITASVNVLQEFTSNQTMWEVLVHESYIVQLETELIEMQTAQLQHLKNVTEELFTMLKDGSAVDEIFKGITQTLDIVIMHWLQNNTMSISNFSSLWDGVLSKVTKGYMNLSTLMCNECIISHIMEVEKSVKSKVDLIQNSLRNKTGTVTLSQIFEEWDSLYKSYVNYNLLTSEYVQNMAEMTTNVTQLWDRGFSHLMSWFFGIMDMLDQTLEETPIWTCLKPFLEGINWALAVASNTSISDSCFSDRSCNFNWWQFFQMLGSVSGKMASDPSLLMRIKNDSWKYLQQNYSRSISDVLQQCFNKSVNESPWVEDLQDFLGQLQQLLYQSSDQSANISTISLTTVNANVSLHIFTALKEVLPKVLPFLQDSFNMTQQCTNDAVLENMTSVVWSLMPYHTSLYSPEWKHKEILQMMDCVMPPLPEEAQTYYTFVVSTLLQEMGNTVRNASTHPVTDIMRALSKTVSNLNNDLNSTSVNTSMAYNIFQDIFGFLEGALKIYVESNHSDHSDAINTMTVVISKFQRLLEAFGKDEDMEVLTNVLEALKIHLTRIQGSSSLGNIIQNIILDSWRLLVKNYAGNISEIIRHYLSQQKTDTFSEASKQAAFWETLIQAVLKNIELLTNTTMSKLAQTNQDHTTEILHTVLEHFNLTYLESILNGNENISRSRSETVKAVVENKQLWNALLSDPFSSDNISYSQSLLELQALVNDWIAVDTNIRQLSLRISRVLIKLSSIFNQTDLQQLCLIFKHILNAESNASNAITNTMQIFCEISHINISDTLTFAQLILKQLQNYLTSDNQFAESLSLLHTYLNFSDSLSLSLADDLRSQVHDVLQALHSTYLEMITSDKNNTKMYLKSLLTVFRPDYENLLLTNVLNKTLKVIEAIDVCNAYLPNCTETVVEFFRLLTVVTDSFSNLTHDNHTSAENLHVQVDNFLFSSEFQNNIHVSLIKSVFTLILSLETCVNITLSASEINSVVDTAVDLMINLTYTKDVNLTFFYTLLQSTELGGYDFINFVHKTGDYNVSALLGHIKNLSVLKCSRQNLMDSEMCTLEHLLYTVELLQDLRVPQVIQDRMHIVESITKYFLTHLSNSSNVLLQLETFYNFTSRMFQNDTILNEMQQLPNMIIYTLSEIKLILKHANESSAIIKSAIETVQDIMHFFTMANNHTKSYTKPEDTNVLLQTIGHHLQVVEWYVLFIKNITQQSDLSDATYPVMQLTELILMNVFSQMESSPTIISILNSFSELLKSVNSSLTGPALHDFVDTIFKTVIPRLQHWPNQTASIVNLLEKVFSMGRPNSHPWDLLFDEESQNLFDFAAIILKRNSTSHVSSVLQILKGALDLLVNLRSNDTGGEMNDLATLAHFENSEIERLLQIIQEGLKILKNDNIDVSLSKQLSSLYSFTCLLFRNHYSSNYSINYFTGIAEWLDLIYNTTVQIINTADVKQNYQNCSTFTMIKMLFAEMMQTAEENVTMKETLMESRVTTGCDFNLFMALNGSVHNTVLEIFKEINSYSNRNISFLNEMTLCAIQQMKASSDILLKFSSVFQLRNTSILQISNVLEWFSKGMLKPNESCMLIDVHASQMLGTILKTYSSPINLLVTYILNQTAVSESDERISQVTLSEILNIIQQFNSLQNQQLWNISAIGLFQFLHNVTNHSEWNQFQAVWYFLNDVMHLKWNDSTIQEYTKLLEMIQSLLGLIENQWGLQGLQVCHFLENVMKQLNISDLLTDLQSLYKPSPSPLSQYDQQLLATVQRIFEHLYSLAQSNSTVSSSCEVDKVFRNISVALMNLFSVNVSHSSAGDVLKAAGNAMTCFTPHLSEQEIIYFNSMTNILVKLGTDLMNSNESTTHNVTEGILWSLHSTKQILYDNTFTEVPWINNSLRDSIDLLQIGMEIYSASKIKNYNAARKEVLAFIDKLQTLASSNSTDPAVETFMQLSEMLKAYVSLIQQGASVETLIKELMNTSLMSIDQNYRGNISNFLQDYFSQNASDPYSETVQIIHFLGKLAQFFTIEQLINTTTVSPSIISTLVNTIESVLGNFNLTYLEAVWAGNKNSIRVIAEILKTILSNEYDVSSPSSNHFFQGNATSWLIKELDKWMSGDRNALSTSLSQYFEPIFEIASILLQKSNSSSISGGLTTIERILTMIETVSSNPFQNLSTSDSQNLKQFINIVQKGVAILSNSKAFDLLNVSNAVFEDICSLLQQEFSNHSTFIYSWNDSLLKSKTVHLLQLLIAPSLKSVNNDTGAMTNCSAFYILHLISEILPENCTMREFLAKTSGNLNSSCLHLPNEAEQKFTQPNLTKVAETTFEISELLSGSNKTELLENVVLCVVQQTVQATDFLLILNNALDLKNPWIQKMHDSLSQLLSVLPEQNATCATQDINGNIINAFKSIFSNSSQQPSVIDDLKLLESIIIHISPFFPMEVGTYLNTTAQVISKLRNVLLETNGSTIDNAGGIISKALFDLLTSMDIIPSANSTWVKSLFQDMSHLLQSTLHISFSNQTDFMKTRNETIILINTLQNLLKRVGPEITANIFTQVSNNLQLYLSDVHQGSVQGILSELLFKAQSQLTDLSPMNSTLKFYITLLNNLKEIIKASTSGNNTNILDILKMILDMDYTTDVPALVKMFREEILNADEIVTNGNPKLIVLTVAQLLQEFLPEEYNLSKAFSVSQQLLNKWFTAISEMQSNPSNFTEWDLFTRLLEALISSVKEFPGWETVQTNLLIEKAIADITAEYFKHEAEFLHCIKDTIANVTNQMIHFFLANNGTLVTSDLQENIEHIIYRVIRTFKQALLTGEELHYSDFLQHLNSSIIHFNMSQESWPSEWCNETDLFLLFKLYPTTENITSILNDQGKLESRISDDYLLAADIINSNKKLWQTSWNLTQSLHQLYFAIINDPFEPLQNISFNYAAAVTDHITNLVVPDVVSVLGPSLEKCKYWPIIKSYLETADWIISYTTQDNITFAFNYTSQFCDSCNTTIKWEVFNEKVAMLIKKSLKDTDIQERLLQATWQFVFNKYNFLLKNHPYMVLLGNLLENRTEQALINNTENLLNATLQMLMSSIEESEQLSAYQSDLRNVLFYLLMEFDRYILRQPLQEESYNITMLQTFVDAVKIVLEQVQQLSFLENQTEILEMASNVELITEQVTQLVMWCQSVNKTDSSFVVQLLPQMSKLLNAIQSEIGQLNRTSNLSSFTSNFLHFLDDIRNIYLHGSIFNSSKEAESLIVAYTELLKKHIAENSALNTYLPFIFNSFNLTKQLTNSQSNTTLELLAKVYQALMESLSSIKNGSDPQMKTVLSNLINLFSWPASEVDGSKTKELLQLLKVLQVAQLCHNTLDNCTKSVATIYQAASTILQELSGDQVVNVTKWIKFSLHLREVFNNSSAPLDSYFKITQTFVEDAWTFLLPTHDATLMLNVLSILRNITENHEEDIAADLFTSLLNETGLNATIIPEPSKLVYVLQHLEYLLQKTELSRPVESISLSFVLQITENAVDVLQLFNVSLYQNEAADIKKVLEYWLQLANSYHDPSEDLHGIYEVTEWILQNRILISSYINSTLMSLHAIKFSLQNMTLTPVFVNVLKEVTHVMELLNNRSRLTSLANNCSLAMLFANNQLQSLPKVLEILSTQAKLLLSAINLLAETSSQSVPFIMSEEAFTNMLLNSSLPSYVASLVKSVSQLISSLSSPNDESITEAIQAIFQSVDKVLLALPNQGSSIIDGLQQIIVSAFATSDIQKLTDILHHFGIDNQSLSTLHEIIPKLKSIIELLSTPDNLNLTSLVSQIGQENLKGIMGTIKEATLLLQEIASSNNVSENLFYKLYNFTALFLSQASNTSGMWDKPALGARLWELIYLSASAVYGNAWQKSLFEACSALDIFQAILKEVGRNVDFAQQNVTCQAIANISLTVVDFYNNVLYYVNDPLVNQTAFEVLKEIANATEETTLFLVKLSSLFNSSCPLINQMHYIVRLLSKALNASDTNNWQQLVNSVFTNQTSTTRSLMSALLNQIVTFLKNQLNVSSSKDWTVSGLNNVVTFMYQIMNDTSLANLMSNAVQENVGNTGQNNSVQYALESLYYLLSPRVWEKFFPEKILQHKWNLTSQSLPDTSATDVEFVNAALYNAFVNINSILLTEFNSSKEFQVYPQVSDVTEKAWDLFSTSLKEVSTMISNPSLVTLNDTVTIVQHIISLMSYLTSVGNSTAHFTNASFYPESAADILAKYSSTEFLTKSIGIVYNLAVDIMKQDQSSKQNNIGAENIVSSLITGLQLLLNNSAEIPSESLAINLLGVIQSKLHDMAQVNSSNWNSMLLTLSEDILAAVPNGDKYATFLRNLSQILTSGEQGGGNQPTLASILQKVTDLLKENGQLGNDSWSQFVNVLKIVLNQNWTYLNDRLTQAIRTVSSASCATVTNFVFNTLLENSTKINLSSGSKLIPELSEFENLTPVLDIIKNVTSTLNFSVANSSNGDIGKQMRVLFQNITTMKQQAFDIAGLDMSIMDLIMKQPLPTDICKVITFVKRCQMEYRSINSTNDAYNEAENEILTALQYLDNAKKYNLSITFLQYLNIPLLLYEYLLPDSIQSEVDTLLHFLQMLNDRLDDYNSKLQLGITYIDYVNSLFGKQKSARRKRATSDNALYSVIAQRLCSGNIQALLQTALPTERAAVVTTNSTSMTNEELIPMYGFPSNSTPFCVNLYRNVVNSPNGKTAWKYMNLLLHGQILFTPVTDLTMKIIEQANASLADLATMAQASNEWKSASEFLWSASQQIQSSDQFLQTFKSTLSKGFVKNLINAKASLDAEDLVSKIDDFAKNVKYLSKNVNTSYNVAEFVKNITSCINLNRFSSADNITQLNSWAQSLLEGNSLFASIIFDVPQNNTTQKSLPSGQTKLPKLVRYTIRSSLLSSMRTNSIKDTYWSPGPQNSGSKNQLYNKGFIYLQESIERAIIALQTGKNIDGIATQIQPMPYPCYISDRLLHSISYSFPIILMIAWVLFIASFVKKQVHEKELRLHEYMKMMGVSSASHFFAWFLECAFFLFVTVIILTIILKGGRILPHSNGFIIFLYLLDYSFSIIAMSFLISAFFDQTNIAGLSGSLIYIISFFPFIVMVSMDSSLGFSGKSLLSLFAPTALSYASQYIASYEDQGIGIQWHNIHLPPSPDSSGNFSWLCWMILIDSGIYFIAGFYIRTAFPGQYGIAAPWYFPLKPSFWADCFGCKKQKGTRTGLMFINIALQQETDLQHKKDDIYNISKNIEPEPQNLPVGISLHGLRKEFGRKIAVHNLNLNFYEGHVTALLGHNGAGKTTTMSMLTGLYGATSGSIFIYGNDIRTDLDNIRQNMGVCMQYDVLFEYLTTKEHLLLYAQIKAPHWSKKELMDEVKKTLTDTGLYNHRHKKACTLSGGMRRKLSICIAFIGGSKTVILDEPTTGVDPYSRRSIWDIVTKKKKDRTIILSTHHLDEAEILSDRIAFLEKGGLKCCGSPFYLKEVFGRGYHLMLSKKYASPGTQREFDTQAVTKFIQKHMPDAQLKEDIGGELTYILPSFSEARPGAYHSLLTALDTNLSKLDLECFGVSDTTLEEVFLRLTENSDVEEGGIAWSKSRSVISIPSNNGPVSDASSVSSYDITDAEVLTGIKKIGTAHLVMKQAFGLIIKRFHHFRRDWKGMIAQIVLPILFVLAAMGLATVSPRNKLPKVQICASMYGGSTQTIPFNSVNFSDPLVSAMLSPPGIDTTCLENPENQYCLKANKLGTWPSSGTPPASYGECNCTDINQYCPGVDYSPQQMQAFSSQKMYNVSGYNMQRYLMATTYNFLHTRYGGWSFGLPLPSSLQNDINPVPANRTLVKVWYNLEGYHSMPAYLNSLSNFILRANLPDHENASEYGISLFSQPYDGQISTQDTMIASLVDTLVGLCILLGYSIMTSSFVIYIVKEYHSGAKQLQHISGMREPFYWLINFIFDMVLYLIPVALSIAIVAAFQLPSFTSGENLGVVSILLILFGVSTLSWMYLLSGIFSNPEIAFIVYVCINLFIGINTIISTSVVYLLTLVTNIENIWYTYQVIRHFFLIFPPYCFGYGLMQLSQLQSNKTVMAFFGYTDTASPYDLEESGWMILALGIQGAVFFSLRLLINKRSLRKFRTLCRKFFKKYLPRPPQISISKTEDQDVQAERERVKGGGACTDLLQLDHISKTYKHMTGRIITAVNNICIGIPVGECFGLLGVNGAGKTTTFKMLTGDIHASSGRAQIRNFDGTMIDITDNKKIRIGYCPQVDALDDLMTGEEHLFYYARLRGIPEKHIKAVTYKLIERLDLVPHKSKPVHMYSCGTKRKLSTALAILGKPQLLLLDEPSSGMDPKSKRHLWKIISEELQNHCAVVLTSHSMEECEALCGRLAIMVKGEFRCIGSLQHIKNRFGSGYTVKLHLTRKMERVDTLTEFMQQHFPGTDLKDHHLNMVEYHVPVSTGGVAIIFQQLQTNKTSLNIKNFSVSQTTLDEVFINFASDQTDPETDSEVVSPVENVDI